MALVRIMSMALVHIRTNVHTDALLTLFSKESYIAA
jgi:hypothetical protein